MLLLIIFIIFKQNYPLISLSVNNRTINLGQIKQWFNPISDFDVLLIDIYSKM